MANSVPEYAIFFRLKTPASIDEEVLARKMSSAICKRSEVSNWFLIDKKNSQY